MALNCSSQTVILEDLFYSYPAISLPCELSLTEKVLTIRFTLKGKTDVETIELSDTVGCHVFRGKHKLKNELEDCSAYICIYSYPLKTSAGILSKQLRRERRALTFQMRKFETQEENLKVVNKWRRGILCIIRGISCIKDEKICIPDVCPAARKFLILVNPRSGPGKAYQVFKERVIPLLTESDTPYELLVTDRANCARDYVKKADLSQWDGIVVVSGDGLLFEVYNGLMARPDWKEAVKIPVGVVPGGSGNGLARTISHAAGEPYDVTAVIPSVLNIIRGRVAPMDLVRVQTPTECFYSFLSVGWGLMADIDIESERLRAFGEARFAVWAVIRAIGLRKYKGKLSYLPVHGYKSDQPAKIITEPKPKRSKTLDSHLAWSDNSALDEAEQERFPIFRSKSFGSNDPDIEDDDKTVRLLKFSYSGEEFIESPSLAVVGSQVVEPSVEENLQDIPHLHCIEERSDADDVASQKEESIAAYHCPPLDSPVPEDWIVIDDEFVLVYVCQQTHISTDVFFAPDAKLDDGIMWLIMIRGGVSRAQVMYFLACLQTGDHVHIPYVDVIPIQAFRLEPSRTDSFLTVDGEVIPCCTIQAEVLPSIARVMSR